jgi:2-iminoacetate synthase ThiH
MFTRQQAIELWESNDILSLGYEADAVRRSLHPEAIVSYTLSEDEGVVEHVFSGSVEERLNSLAELCQREISVVRPLVLPTATGMEYLKTMALSRLFLDNVSHLQATWKLFGVKVAQLSLRFGADDLGLAEGNASEEELRRLIRDAGFVPKQRDALFRSYSIA